jgi:hypothetical protein
MTLHIGTGIDLPDASVTETFGILGQRGTGKTSTAVVLIEEMSHVAPYAVIDPTGAWYGLRSSRSGKGPGLDVVVLGGHNGDVPLEAASGKMVAELILADRYSVVLDLELLHKTEQIRFVAEFLEALYHGNREARHVVVDEAHRFAPQNPRGEGGFLPRCMGAVEDVVKLGRRKGLGATLISQRPAGLSKEVLEQTATLIVHRVQGPRDRKAIAEWFQAQGDPPGEAAAMMEIPRLPRGKAYILSPSFLEFFGAVQIRQKRTFDSSATPEVGATTETPVGRSKVDMAALRDRMAATLERAKADDPAELRKIISNLKAQLFEAQRKPVEIVEKVVERVIEREVVPQSVVDAISGIVLTAEELVASLKSAVVALQIGPAPVDKVRLTDHTTWEVPRAQPVAIPREVQRVRDDLERIGVHLIDEKVEGAEEAVKLAKAERLALTALAQYPEGRTKTQIAVLTGYAVGGGGFANALGRLRSLGFIDGRSENLRATPAGIMALGGDWNPLPTGEALAEYWYQRLGKAERLSLQVLVQEYPSALPRVAIAERAGYEAKGGGFANALGRLRTLELVVPATSPGGGIGLRASDALFDGA